jgi:hypothetical protein
LAHLVEAGCGVAHLAGVAEGLLDGFGVRRIDPAAVAREKLFQLDLAKRVVIAVFAQDAIVVDDVARRRIDSFPVNSPLQFHREKALLG